MPLFNEWLTNTGSYKNVQFWDFCRPQTFKLDRPSKSFKPVAAPNGNYRLFE